MRMILYESIILFAVRGNTIPHITQWCTQDYSSGNVFSAYVTPKVPISNEAELVTKLTMDGGIMKYNGVPVTAFSISETLQKFLDSLGTSKNVVLAAHNGRTFDFKILTEALEKTRKLESFTKHVIGFCDTIAMLKKILPKRPSYKQEQLVKGVMNKQYNAHDATQDVSALRDLLLHLKVKSSDFLKHTFSSKSIHEQNIYVAEKKRNIGSLDILVQKLILKRTLAEKIAGSGLTLRHLKTIYVRKGEDGLRDTFEFKNAHGDPRVTKNKQLLDEIIPKLGEYFSSI